MKKITESFFKLSNEDRCKILRSEKSGRLDYETLIEAQWFGDSDVRDLARELALKIPVEKLDYKTLIKSQGSGCSDARDLARELALKIPVEERGLESSEYEKFILEFLT